LGCAMTEPRGSYVAQMLDSRRGDWIISFLRPGKAHAISRYALLNRMQSAGFDISERELREDIKQLRRAGKLICSTPGEGGGYYLATSPEEVEEFLDTELRAKRDDLSQTIHAIEQSAHRTFHQAQPSLL
jgi:predicted DNA-binding transcriptional regulator YafY